MATQWIDYRQLREALRFTDVLALYNVQLKVKGDRASGFCPLPGHNGKRRSPSFSVHLRRGIFQCFGCQAKGNLLDFAALMERVDPRDAGAFRQVMLKLQDRLGGPASPPPAGEAWKPPPQTKPALPPDDTRERIINAPIGFELKHLDPTHPYLASRGFTPDAIAHFGLGYCVRGLMAGRIAIPIHDATGTLVGYAGRVVDDSRISDECPKYLFPGEREHDGKIYAFRKSLLLYNAHRVGKGLEQIVVVEGFASVWWLTQLGVPHVVALMGASCSTEQATLITKLVSPAGNVVIVSDGDDGGERCAQSALFEIARHRLCRWARLESGVQPTDLDEIAFLTPDQLMRERIYKA
jgi:DNA primase